MERTELTVTESQAGQRIDQVLPPLLAVTRATVQKWCETQRVTVGGLPQNKKYLLKAGDRIAVDIPEPQPCGVAAEEIPLDIVYEDSDLLIVNKPKGMVVHPAAGHADGTLCNALMAHCGDSLSGIGGVMRPGIVHRIDKDTSGLLMVAKNDRAHQSLAAQIKEHSFTRVYETVVIGHLNPPCGTVDAPIGRDPLHRQRMAVTEKNSKRAVTHYEVLEALRGYDYVRVTLETGRTHQIRVHMAYKGHPVAGDTVYGPKKGIPGFTGQCLHAKVIGFRHPADGRYMEFESELPDYFRTFLDSIGHSADKKGREK